MWGFPEYGVNWIGHLVETYNKSLLFSYNFAYGGAVVDASIAAPYEDTVLTLVNQTAEFVDNLSPALSTAAWTADNSLSSSIASSSAIVVSSASVSSATSPIVTSVVSSTTSACSGGDDEYEA